MKRAVAQGAPFGIFLFALIFLSFVGGALATLAGLSPTGYIRDAYRAGAAFLEKRSQERNPYTTDLWNRCETKERGVTKYDQGRAYDGLTLYTSGDGPKALLMAMDGRIVHTWERPFSSVWDESAAVRDPVPDRQTFFNKAYVYPNGDLLAIYIGVGDSPYGYGMVKLDRESRVIWKNLDYFHHDFSVAADGRIYALTHSFRQKFPKGVDHLDIPFMDDFLVVLSPQGRTLKKLSLLDALNRSEYRRLLWLIPHYTRADPLHTNAVDFLDGPTARKLARKLPAAAEGQVLLSFRELACGSIGLLDVHSGEFVWISRGSWLSQHDPDVLPTGDILVFDNRGHFGPGGKSRIIEVDPGTGGVVWHYAGDRDHPFESLIRGDQQRLPNGNTLIADSSNGRLLEVTSAGDIVWEYINPVRGGKENRHIAVVSSVERIDPARLAADFRAGIRDSNLVTGELAP